MWAGDRLFNKVLVARGFARVTIYPPNMTGTRRVSCDEGHLAGSGRVQFPLPSISHRRPGHPVLLGRGRHSRDELWKSDGTEAGTVMVKDIRPGEDSSSQPLFLTDVGGTMYFAAFDGEPSRVGHSFE